MINSQIQGIVDSLWLDFHSNGITDPSTIISQISYLMFASILDENEKVNEARALALDTTFDSMFSEDEQQCRWSHFKELPADEMIEIVRDQLFPYLRSEKITDNPVGHFLKKAQFSISNANVLVKAVAAIDDLPLTDSDTKGDLYEYLLSKLSTAGVAGQFRTPRHIIRSMVELVDLKPTDTICDPACGTAGFLVGAMDYLKEKYTSPEQVHVDEDGNKHYSGDLLHPHKTHIQNDMFRGFDFDETMLRIAAMNLLLHGVTSPGIYEQDTLSGKFRENRPEMSSDHFTVILANPPFKGSFDKESLDPTIKNKVNTGKSELLFLPLIERMLTIGGRAAVIVPDGVLFGGSNAHKAVRKMLIEENNLEGVISLPGGVFKPYAGVSTAILVFTKGGKTKDVWYYDIQADGYSLDDKRNPQPDKNDLPDMVEQWGKRRKNKKAPRTGKFFHVPKKEIVDNEYDLSLNRYKEVVYEEVDYGKPTDILKKIGDIDAKLIESQKKLKGLLK